DAGKDRAAQILSDAKLSFSKMAELIEQRRLLLRPRIVASLKRMDQPEMLGDAAFRDAGSALRREGQSFRQIAEAIELNRVPEPRYEAPVQTSEPLYEMASEPGVRTWVRVANIVARFLFFPVRRPLRFFVIALPFIVLLSILRGVPIGQQISGFVDTIVGARERTDSVVSSFVDRRTSRQSEQAAPSPTPSAPVPSPAAPPSPSPATPSTAPTTAWAPPAPAPSASEAAPAAPPPAAPATPPASTPRLDARGAPSKSAANDRQTVRPRTFEDLMPTGIRRNSRMAG